MGFGCTWSLHGQSRQSRRLLDRPFAALSLAPSFAEPAHFSPLEIVLLLACVLLSAGLFFWRFAPILRNILHSRKDPDLSLHVVRGHNLGPRIWNFFWEVLCQAKVIRQRPLPGLLHAFVFWGFLAFALVTLNHFAVGLGHRLPLPRQPHRPLLLPLRRRSGRCWSPSPSPASSSAASSSAPSGSAKRSPTSPASSPSSSSC